MGIEFAAGLVLVGAVLAVAAALSGVMHGTVLSTSVLAVVAGVVLSLTGTLDPDAGSSELVHLIELALVFTLFSDALVAERELVTGHWRNPARALVVAMPITGVLLALVAKLLFGDSLTWPEAFLLGAVLAPTDPVVSSTLVNSERVPPLIRHTLNLESGLNDGLALPFVLILLAVTSAGGEPGSEALAQVGETFAGAGIGLVVAFLGGRALDRIPGGGITPNYEGVYGLALALLAFGLAELSFGNGLIAAFVSGIVLALAERDLPDAFAPFNENLSAVFQVVTFLLFGALVVDTGFDGSVLALVAFIVFALVVARPAAVFLAFAGSDLPRPQKLFIAWFGPKGVASMLFALFVLNSTAPDRAVVFDVASFVILASIFAHGLTDTVGARWIESRVRA